jgi:hypothetical protein
MLILSVSEILKKYSQTTDYYFIYERRSFRTVKREGQEKLSREWARMRGREVFQDTPDRPVKRTEDFQAVWLSASKSTSPNIFYSPVVLLCGLCINIQTAGF